MPAWAISIPGNYAGLKTGDQLTLIDLLYISISTSDGPATWAIGDIVSYGGTAGGADVPNLPFFVDLMNVRTATLGMNDTQFADPGGGLGNHTTSADMAWLLRFAMNNSLFRDVTTS